MWQFKKCHINAKMYRKVYLTKTIWNIITPFLLPRFSYKAQLQFRWQRHCQANIMFDTKMTGRDMEMENYYQFNQVQSNLNRNTICE